MGNDLPELTVRDATAWRAWLEAHHEQPDGVWVVLANKGVTEPTSLSYEQAVEEALCFGWIDGQTRAGDGSTHLQRFSPRRSRSRWSKRIVERVARLEAQGRMHPAGRAEVERAKADGRWEEAYPGPATAEVPADLAAALAASPRAKAMFEILTSSNRFAILYQLGDAKRAETRARRLQRFVDMLARGETPYPQKRTLDG
jgi:uncharacterized protein YdeI (YjbR/CyaY-like superfamily)